MTYDRCTKKKKTYGNQMWKIDLPQLYLDNKPTKVIYKKRPTNLDLENRQTKVRCTVVYMYKIDLRLSYVQNRSVAVRCSKETSSSQIQNINLR